jgi:type IV pilus assembly protein PilY1
MDRIETRTVSFHSLGEGRQARDTGHGATPLTRAIRARLGAALLLLPLSASALAALDIADKPLILPSPMTPNVVLTIEEAGTMRRGVPPYSTNLADYTTTPEVHARRYHYSAHYNPLYYNPNITYIQPKKPDGSSYSTSFTNAYKNGYDSASGTVNLGSQYRPTYEFDPTTNKDTLGKHPIDDVGDSKPFSTVSVDTKAYYYKFKDTCDPVSDKENVDCYVLVWVSESEKQNFANWYSFYRTRYLATITALHLAMDKLKGKIRLAWQGTSTTGGNFCMNLTGSNCRDRTGASVNNSLRPFEGAHRDTFYQWLSRLGSGDSDISTSMRAAMKRVGDYLSDQQRYCDDLTSAVSTNNPARSCRDNVHIMISDGETRDAASVVLDDFPSSDIDSVNISVTSSFPLAYSPKPPFMDYPKQSLPDKKECYHPYVSYSNCLTQPEQWYLSEGGGPLKVANAGTLADIAFYYWMKDLAPGLDNNILPYMPDQTGTTEAQKTWNPRNNPATWQHIVNYAVITGMSYVLGTDWKTNTYDGAQAQGQKNWPYLQGLSAVHPSRIYDYWHAALNSRGQFYGVDEVDKLVQALEDIAERIEKRLAASATIAANSTRLDTGTVLYQGRFTAVDWTGELIASQITPTGTVGAELWQATIPAAASRQLYTYAYDTKGVAYDNTALLPTNWAAQVGVSGATAAEVLAWLRGDQSQEQTFDADGNLTGGRYRKRATRLGDIVNSDPVYVGHQHYGHAVLPEGGTAYKSFVDGNKNRVKMLYVGANDGMLHGFVAGAGSGAGNECGGTLGQELFAYIPKAVRSKLPTLANPQYGQPGGIPHQYFVDGPAYVGDAYLDGAWKTVLLGTTGAGARAIFALDVTNPCAFDANKVLWELDETWDADLGFTLAKPIIARLNNGKWAAVFGNGYNSGSGKAVLFLVELSTGNLIKKFDLGGTDNGLAAPSLYDADGNGTTDYIYAGDLKGRLWKFDLTASSEGSWSAALGGAPMFTAVDPDGKPQPITAAPELGAPPAGTSGVMVYFGTGRWFVYGDETDLQVQSLYGLLDDGTSIAERSDLVRQEINAETTVGGKKVRKVTSNGVDLATQRGWYLDLLPPTGPAQGERVISTPRRQFGRVFYTTMIPSDDPCKFGGTSWLIELDPMSGAMPTASIIDLGGEVVAGVMSSVGIVKSFDFLSGEGAVAIGLGSTGTTEAIRLNPPVVSPRIGRVSWREIID